MNTKYYSLPLNLSSVFRDDNEKMKTCSEVESIDQYIELILMTCPGEHKFNKEFGCRIWEMDFENVVSRNEWVDTFTRYVADAIIRFEKRLSEVSVEISVNDVARQDHVTRTTAIKKEVKIYVISRLTSNGEPCKFYYALYLGPLSTE